MKKINLFLLITFAIILLSLNVKAESWNLSTASYDNASFDVTSQGVNPKGIFFNASGNKMYITGDSDDRVTQNTLSTAWNVSTASYDGDFFDIGQDTIPSGLFFNASGNKMYVVGDFNNRVFQYTLSTAWNVSTASYDNSFFDVGLQDAEPRSVFFNASGNKMYVVGDFNNRVFQYTLSTAWNVSTASYDDVSFNIGNQDTNPSGMFFNASGNKMYVGGGVKSIVFQYNLLTRWDIGSSSYDGAYLNVTIQDTGLVGIFFNASGNKIYLTGITGDKIYQYLTITSNVIPIINNVSITPLPLEIGNTAKGHANYSDVDSDVAGGNQTLWYVNNTLILEANNSFNLGSGNLTLDSNITFSARFNDTKNWSIWTNSSIITVGDTIAPVLNNCNLSSTSITDASGNTINLTCEATDASSNIQSMSFDINGTTLNGTRTFSFTQSKSVTSTYTIYASLETIKVSSNSIMNVSVTDNSGNKVVNSTNFHWVVTEAPSGGGSSPSGGGGGGGSIPPTQPQCKGNELLVSNKCVNASLFNVTLKVIGLANIQPIVFYRTCGNFQEWRQLIKTNKILKSAVFDKPQINVNVTVIGSDALVVKKLRTLRISERIDLGNLKMTDTTQQVARVFIALRVVSLCNPLTYLFIAVPITIFIFRKKLRGIFKRKN